LRGLTVSPWLVRLRGEVELDPRHQHPAFAQDAVQRLLDALVARPQILFFERFGFDLVL
jgi:hypothetical protein